MTTARRGNFHSQLLPRYARRTREVEAAVLGSYLAGANSRRIRTALKPLLVERYLSKSAVSRIVAQLKALFTTWQTRDVCGERYAVLFLDGFHLKVRMAKRIVAVPVLAALGVLENGQKRNGVRPREDLESSAASRSTTPQRFSGTQISEDGPEGGIMLNVRSLTPSDLPAADRIIRVAFGTFLGAPEPNQFWADLAYARTRWAADPTAAFGAEWDGELVGSNFATRWGSVGFFGPLTVRPDLWDRKIAQRLMDPIIERFDAWGVTHAGLFTFAQSPKHLGLYYKYGFRPRFLTSIMSKPAQVTIRRKSQWSAYSQLSESGREESLKACRDVTVSIYPGLDVEREIRAVQVQGLGETVLLHDSRDLVGFAVCHCGPGTEAGNQKCYVKFGAAKPGAAAEERFDQLLDACEELAVTRSLARIEAGTNLARHEAYGKLLARGFRTDIQGVTMHRPNEEAYSRAGVYVIDDWR